MDYTTKTVKELKELCKEKDLKLGGTKQVLIERLQDYNNEKKIDKYRFIVFVKTLMGTIYTINIKRESTIEELKQKVMEYSGYPVDKQRLYYICYQKAEPGDVSYPNGQTGKQTENDKTLSDYAVLSESTFFLEVKLR